MADKKKVQKTGEATEARPPGGKLKWIILGSILLLVLAGGGGAAYYFLLYEPAEPSEETEGETPEEAEAAAPIPPSAPLIYHELESFTVNLASPGPVRFLRISMTVVTRNPAVVAAMDTHKPMIRNDVLALLAAQEFAAVNTAEGKQGLRDRLREMIAGILTKSGSPAEITDILFTDLVMQ